MTQLISMIAAHGRYGVIGKDGRMPWGRLGPDMAWFRRHTLGKAIVMGRVTHESIGFALPGRRNIILSRDRGYVPASGAVVVHDTSEVLDQARDASEVVVIGGAQIYAAFMPHVTRFYQTKIYGEFEGDTQFPFPDDGWPDDWAKTSSVVRPPDTKCTYELTFQVWDKL